MEYPQLQSRFQFEVKLIPSLFLVVERLGGDTRGFEAVGPGCKPTGQLAGDFGMVFNQILPFVGIALKVKEVFANRRGTKVFPFSGANGGLVPKPPVERLVRRAAYRISQKWNQVDPVKLLVAGEPASMADSRMR